jgi:hypothetical protein
VPLRQASIGATIKFGTTPPHAKSGVAAGVSSKPSGSLNK